MQIGTDRLVLRIPREEDLDCWADFMSDGVATQFIGGPQPRSIAWRAMATVAGSWQLRGYGMFSVIERATNKWIGRIGPWYPEGWPGLEIGWGLARDAWGKGYAFEGAAAAMNWAFGVLGQQEVFHCIAPGNAASEALARKLGSSFLGPCALPPPFAGAEVDLWGQSGENWRRNGPCSVA